MARPSSYTDQVGQAICARISEGCSLRSIARDEGMPSLQTIFNWFQSQPTFLEQYARAKEAQMDAFAEEIVDISDDGRNDWMELHEKDNAGWKANGEHIQRSRLRVDSRKWLMSKLKPKKYGERLDMNLGGQQGNPVEVDVKLSPAEAYHKLLNG